LTESDANSSELLITLAISHPNAPPAIAVQQEDRPGKGEALGTQLLAATPSGFDEVEHADLGFSTPELETKATHLGNSYSVDRLHTIHDLNPQ
jgi:hypothetical protein